MAQSAVGLLPVTFLGAFGPRCEGIHPDGGYRYVTPTVSHLLPWEISQRSSPAGQVADHRRLKVQFLNCATWWETRPERRAIDGAARADLMVISLLSLAALRLGFGPHPPSRIAIRRGTWGKPSYAPMAG